MNLAVKKIYWILAASLLALPSSNILNATENLAVGAKETIKQPTPSIENIPNLTWPLLPGENVNGLAVMFYPNNKAMQKRFVAATLQLSRDMSPGFTASTAYNQTTTIIIPELRALSLRHPHAANSVARLRMSYRLASAELEQVTPAMQAEYEYLTQRNEKMNVQLTQLNQRIAMQEAKIAELKKATLLWLEKQKKLEEEQAKAAAIITVTPSSSTQFKSEVAENSSPVVTPQVAQQPAEPIVSTPPAASVSKSYPLVKPMPKAAQAPDLLSAFIDYTLWVLASLVILGVAVLVWMRFRQQTKPFDEEELAIEPLPMKSFLDEDYDDEYDSEPMTDGLDESDLLASQTHETDITKTLPPELASLQKMPVKTSIHLTDGVVNQGKSAKAREPSSHTLGALTISFDEMSMAVDKAKLLMDASKPNQAIDLLQHTINGQPSIALEPWLCLLDIYRTLDKKSEFLNLAKRFHQGFNVRLPQWGPEEVYTDSLEDFGHVIKTLTAVWQTDKARDYIQKLILDSRGGERVGFSLSILEDLLMLDQLLEIRDEITQREALA